MRAELEREHLETMALALPSGSAVSVAARRLAPADCGEPGLVRSALKALEDHHSVALGR